MTKFSEVITIRVQKDWKEVIDKITEQEGWGSPAEYIRDLIREDLKRRGFIKEVKK